jgi:hypothetical protein
MKSVICMYCNKYIYQGELDYPTEYQLKHGRQSYCHTQCYDDVLMILCSDPEYRRMMDERCK